MNMDKKIIKINKTKLRGIVKEALNEVVDELNLYHGTNADFDKFDVAYMSTGWGKQAYGYGFYLTNRYETAKEYAYDSKNGQVMEVEVPDGKYLSYKSISQREKQNIAQKLFKYLTEENPDTMDSYSDSESKQCLWEYEIKSILNCADGEWVYGTISSILGDDKETSEFLHRIGYVGLKHFDDSTHDTTYVIFNQNDIKILKKNAVMNEDVEKYNNSNPPFVLGGEHDKGVGKFGMFRLSPQLQSCINEAAFQLLGFERFAINGEITFGGVMDNPWDDAYHVLKWAIDNKGLNPKYLERVSGELYAGYYDEIQNGKRFWFSKEELGNIFKCLPDGLRRELVKDMINVGRIGKINEMIEYLKDYNGGENLEEFIQIMKNMYKNGEIKRGNIVNLKEPVKKAMETCRMLPQGK